MSKAIGLPFCSELVPKVLDGSKWNTRRIPGIHNCRLLLGDKDRTGRMKGLDWSHVKIGANLDGSAYFIVFHPKDNLWYELAPRHEPGDIAWMRENHRFVEHEDGQDFIQYLADGAEHPIPNVREYCDYTVGRYNRNRPSIHMPRWVCRKEMVLTGVRIELIQDISEDDAKAEGALLTCSMCGNNEVTDPDGSIHYACDDPDYEESSYCEGFRRLWDRINAARGWGWKLNRPVVVFGWESFEEMRERIANELNPSPRFFDISDPMENLKACPLSKEALKHITGGKDCERRKN